MKHLLLKAKKENWSLKGPGSWDYSIWKLYDDGSYNHVIKFIPEDFDKSAKKETYKDFLDENIFQEIKALSKEHWPRLLIDGCDGTAWEFVAYDGQGVKLQSFECGYITGIEILERIVYLLPGN